jgi:hypothetical protein
MSDLKDAKPVLGPLLTWSKSVIDESRQLGHKDDEIAGWIKAYAKDKGWTKSQIGRALRFNGVKKPDPITVICPKCDDVGRFNTWHDKRRGNRTYLTITHGPRPGYWYWGKDTEEKSRYRKRTRCRFGKLTSYQKQRLLDQLYERLELVRKYG